MSRVPAFVLALTACSSPDPVPLTAGGLDATLFVATHPLESFARSDRQLDAVVEDYRIEFFDRNDAFNDTYFRSPGSYSRAHFRRTSALGIPSSTYFSYDPIHHGGTDHDFAWKYANTFKPEDRWVDVDGAPLEDPIAGGAVLDAQGRVQEHWDPGRVRMSASNPNFERYHRDSMTFAAEEVGANGFNFDLYAVAPHEQDGDPGDFSAFSVDRFRTRMGDPDLDIAAYWRTHGPADTRPDDPVFREFFWMMQREQAGLFRSLQEHAHALSEEHGTFMPMYGNALFGDPSLQHNWGGPASFAAGHFSDLVQMEVEYPLHARDGQERLLTAYRMAHAVAEHSKPVWALPVAFFEPGVPDVFGPSGADRGVPVDAPLDNMFRLYLAEAWATDSVPCLDLNGWPGMDMYGTALADGETIPAIADTIAFVDEHRALLETPESAARTAVLISLSTRLAFDGPYFGRDARDAEATWGAGRALEHLGYSYDFVALGHPELWDDADALERLHRYDQLVLPPSPALTDAQRDELATFVRGGGHLVAVEPAHDGPVSGSHDAWGDPIGYDWLAELAASPGAGTVAPLPWYDVAALHADPSSDTAGLEDALAVAPLVALPGLSEDERRHVGVSALRVDGQTVVHLVNYDFAWDERGGRFAAREGLRVELDLPFTSATAYSPHDGTVVPLQVEGAGVVLPRLASWAFIVAE